MSETPHDIPADLREAIQRAVACEFTSVVHAASDAFQRAIAKMSVAEMSVTVGIRHDDPVMQSLLAVAKEARNALLWNPKIPPRERTAALERALADLQDRYPGLLDQ